MKGGIFLPAYNCPFFDFRGRRHESVPISSAPKLSPSSACGAGLRTTSLMLYDTPFRSIVCRRPDRDDEGREKDRLSKCLALN